MQTLRRFRSVLLIFITITGMVTGMNGLSALAEGPGGSESGKKMAEAVFAGGCFWCMEKPYEKLDGVKEAVSGYTGGHRDHPTYKEVSSGSTGHYEAVKVVYDPEKVSYARLLAVFWQNIDPHNANGQFCDTGPQYRAAIFTNDPDERALALAGREALQNSGALSGPIVTEILPASTFWPAEDYHQNYYRENPFRYRLYRGSCGRDARLRAVWQGVDVEAILAGISPAQ